MGNMTKDVIYCPKIRLFRWNEKLVDKKNLLTDSRGFCLFDVISTAVAKTDHPDLDKIGFKRAYNRNCDRVTTFELDSFLSAVEAADDDDDDDRRRHQDSLIELATTLVAGTSLFTAETAAELGRQISTHFANDYHQLENKGKLFGSSIGGGPRFVMVVQIRILRLFEYIGTEPQSPPLDETLTDNRNGDEEGESSSDSDKVDEYLENWGPDEVRWYHYSDEAAAFWLGLRNYLGEPKHDDNLLTKPITKEEPRGLWEIPPTSLALRHLRTDDSEEPEPGKEGDEDDEDDEEEMSDKFSCSICLNGFEVDFLDNIERTVCGHVFHRTCIWIWLYRANSCPVCRRSLPLLASNVYIFKIET
ncbi:OLC1v1035271C1 [Oldenlandia corymbosa var. corymbosa]|uniref:RING-type E3 ubiquitin transferase n=1 Tax=Oldenlandia corymbosa var. corymbosa TaxID=529605 RepID=A0AAV1CUB8_OLDCO|nr:OLC1v1035271C1 [Oldenlandia corymbosa var. corymbosa]